ncbi:MAG: M6 family metalloprotease domain-containing protein [Polyangiales bacterium]
MSAGSARADIVWEGQTVSAWPDIDTDPTHAHDDDHGPFLAQRAARGIFPAPKGVVRGLTILVDFSDQGPIFSAGEIDALLNQKGYKERGVNGSVRDYFLDQSNGMVDFQNDVVGYFRASKPKSYYQGGTGYNRSYELWNEVIAGLDSQIDFSKYDNDGDGRTEAIAIVYPGDRGTWGKGIWPHATGSSTRRDGVVLARYLMATFTYQLGIYTFAHESGHMLFGWPDLYGFGDYCVMGNSSSQTNPAGINDFFRADQGWIPRVDVTAATRAAFTATPNGAGYYYVNPADPSELFFWSNVQNTGRWAGLRGGGLLVHRFVGKRRTNNPPSPLMLSVVQADGLDQLGGTQWPRPGSDPNDFFFGGGRSEISDATTPNTRWASGAPSGLRVHGIGPKGPQMAFSVGGPAAAQPVAARSVPEPNATAAEGVVAEPIP